MSKAADTIRAAWGMELSNSSIVLLRVIQTELGAWRVEQKHRLSADAFWTGGAFDTATTEVLSRISANEPLGLCFPDKSMMCRGLPLPSLPADVTDKMVNAQAASMYFVGDERLTWTWQAFENPNDSSTQWIVLCAAQRELIEKLRRAFPTNVSLRVVMPRALSAMETASNISRFHFELSNDNTTATCSLVNNGYVLRASVIDRDNSESEDDWIRDARQAVVSQLQGIDSDRRPTVGVVRAGDLNAARSFAEALAPTIGVGLDAEQIDPLAVATAVAKIALQGATDHTSLNFETRSGIAKSSAAIPRRAVGRAAIVCVAVLLLWYGIDWYRDRSLTKYYQQMHDAEAAPGGGIERRLAIGHYLEKNASPALVELDTVLNSAPSLSFTAFGLSATGQFHLTGMINSESELDDFMRKLSTSMLLTNVQLRSARVEQNRWQIEITADSTPAAGLMPATTQPAAPSAPRVTAGRATIGGGA